MPETPSGIFFISYFGSGKKVREFESYYLIRRSFLAIVCIGTRTPRSNRLYLLKNDINQLILF